VNVNFYYFPFFFYFFKKTFVPFYLFIPRILKAVCNPTCVHGNCIAPNQCLCDIGWGSSNCNQCANGYYPNNGNCSECDNCNNGVCSDGPSGDGSCQCNTGYATPLNSTQHCTICSDGYVMDNFICVLCHPTCQTCDFNSTHCTS